MWRRSRWWCVRRSSPLTAVKDALAGSKIGLGAQNVFWEEKGAFTGEISAVMLKDLVTYVIIGHSERRQYFGETDATVNKRVKAALAHGLTPIVCVGETLAQREAGETAAVVTQSSDEWPGGIDRRGSEIDRDCVRTGVGHRHRARFHGRGCQCRRRAEHPRAVEQVVRRMVAQGIRVQYGGSVTPANIEEFMGAPEIDGALVGGASLKVPTSDIHRRMVKSAGTAQDRNGQATKKPRQVDAGPFCFQARETYLMASLSCLTGRAFTTLLAGLALKMAGWPVKGLMPSRCGHGGLLDGDQLDQAGQHHFARAALAQFLVDDFVQRGQQRRSLASSPGRSSWRWRLQIPTWSCVS